MEYHPAPLPKPRFYFNEIRPTTTETIFVLNDRIVHREPREVKHIEIDKLEADESR